MIMIMNQIIYQVVSLNHSLAFPLSSLICMQYQKLDDGKACMGMRLICLVPRPILIVYQTLTLVLLTNI